MERLNKILMQHNKLERNYKSSEQDKKEVNCKLCNDKGVYYDPATNSAGRCPNCGTFLITKERLERRGLFERVMSNTLESYKVSSTETQEALNKTIDYIANFSTDKSILFCGQVGSGKTHLALAIVKELMSVTPILPFIYVEELGTLKVLRNSFNAEERLKYDEKIKACREATVLLIEDLFWGKVGDTELQIAYDIINYRISNNKATIITTELTREQLLELDEALGSRLIYMCGEYIVEFPHNMRNNFRINS